MPTYPESEELEEIRNWDHKRGWQALMDFIKSIWWVSDWGFSQRGNRFILLTGGWSGNEDIIAAMGENYLFWSICWMSSERGGRHAFVLPGGKRKAKKLTKRSS